MYKYNNGVGAKSSKDVKLVLSFFFLFFLIVMDATDIIKGCQLLLQSELEDWLIKTWMLHVIKICNLAW